MLRVALIALLGCSLIFVAGCGGSGGGGGGTTIQLFQPDVLFSHADGAVRLLGTGFGRRRDEAKLVFTAESGTPFAGGTSNVAEMVAVVDSDVQIRGTLPATFVAEDVPCTVRLMLPGGKEADSGGVTTTILAQGVSSMTPNNISSGSNVPFKITGRGFGPPQGLVSVRFNATVGTPFAGGSAPTFTTLGTVTSPECIEGIMPTTAVDTDTDATVTVILAEGVEMTSPAPVIHLIPVPTVTSFTPGIVPGGATPAFTVGGTAFSPIGGTATITLEAIEDPPNTPSPFTPFLDGTSATVSFPGNIDSGSVISGTLIDINPNASGFANVTVTLAGGISATSTFPLVMFVPPPTLSTFTPGTILSGIADQDPWATSGTRADQSFSITGTDFGTVGGTVNLTFTADTGTPFAGGTSATFTATANIDSATSMSGTLSDPATTASVGVTVTATFPSGAVATSAAAFATVAPATFTAPTYDTGLHNGGLPASDDSSHLVTMPFSFPFYATSYTTGRVNSNGFVNFGSAVSGSGSFIDNPNTLTSNPMFAGWWDDIRVNAGGAIYYDNSTYSDRWGASWSSAVTYGSGTVTFQIVGWDTGRIDVAYGSMGTPTGTKVVGIGPGTGSTSATDWSGTTLPSCGNFGSSTAPYEQNSSTIDVSWIMLYPDGNGGYNWASSG